MDSNPTAGWYPDPSDPRRMRYWNGSEWTERTATSRIKSRASKWIVLVGVLIAVAPFFVAFLYSGNSSMWDESSGGGAAIWAVLMTFPLGGAIAIFGPLVANSIARRKARKDVTRLSP